MSTLSPCVSEAAVQTSCPSPSIDFACQVGSSYMACSSASTSTEDLVLPPSCCEMGVNTDPPADRPPVVIDLVGGDEEVGQHGMPAVLVDSGAGPYPSPFCAVCGVLRGGSGISGGQEGLA